MSHEDETILPLRDLRRSDLLVRGLFVVLTIVALASQLQPEIAEWLAGGSVQAPK